MNTDKQQFTKTLDINGKKYLYYALEKLAQETSVDIKKFPRSIKILLENLLRHADNDTAMQSVKNALQWGIHKGKDSCEINFRPTRVLMQDFTGIPAIADLASMRDAMQDRHKPADLINPLTPVDLVIDHSVMVDHFASNTSLSTNVELEYQRNQERYEFLRWGQKAFRNLRVVPPGTGICHQVNLEYLAKTVWTSETDDGQLIAYPDTVVGTDSHTTMINGLAVLGWGVGGIEAEAAMLGQPISMLLPEVIGVHLTGQLQPGMTATDLVLTITQMLRQHGVVGKFVEYFGSALASLSLEDRATIANMAPEYGATCGFFPIDDNTLHYLNLTGRSDLVPLIQAYSQEQGIWYDHTQDNNIIYTDILELDISTIQPSLAGPKRPQDRVLLSQVPNSFQEAFPKADISCHAERVCKDGDVVIAAITSCTNTSNPSVMVAAGLLAQKALKKGLKTKPWVKTSLAPGSQVAQSYLENSGLQASLNAMGFQIVGFGCTTCIGNSGPLPEHISQEISELNLTVGAVLSGNRNFEGRVHPQVKANYLASPPLVVAYALAGNLNLDLSTQPLGKDTMGNDVFLADIWPTQAEIQAIINQHITPSLFHERYASVFSGDTHWQNIAVTDSQTFDWHAQSTYIQPPPFFHNTANNNNQNLLTKGRVLAVFGDSITTDHISPAGVIKKDSPAGSYLMHNGVAVEDFNAYGTRRGNHEVMMRGTFANIRIRNELTPEIEGGVTLDPSDHSNIIPIYDAAMKHQAAGNSLIVFAGREYGTGSSRDWAAKGTKLLGIRAVVTESFERIHRSNLVGMGILPLVFKDGITRHDLGLTGQEIIDIPLKPEALQAGCDVPMHITYGDGQRKDITLLCRIDTDEELAYYHQGGILSYTLERLAQTG